MATIAIVAVILGGVAGALILLAAERDRREAEELQRQQTAEANAAAEEFFNDLRAHEEVWSDQHVNATFGRAVAGSFSNVNLDSTDLAGPAEGLVEACAEQEMQVNAFAVLEESTRPTLAQVPGTSSAYRRAEAAARDSAVLAEAEATYLDEGRGLSEDLLAYCQAWADGLESLAAEQAEFHERLEAAQVSQGESQSEGNWTLECTHAEGCVPLVRADREEYADATVQYFDALYDTKVVLLGDHCLDGYQEYCDAELALAEAERDAAHDAMELLRGPLGSGDEAVPGYPEAVAEWVEMVEEGREENSRILERVNPEITTGVLWPFGSHQHHVLRSWESSIAEMAGMARYANHMDQA